MDRYSIMLGNLIVETRKQQKKTQQALATELCISKQYLSDIERGNRHPVDYHFLKSLASVLHLEMDYLHYLTGTIPNDIRHADASREQAIAGWNAFRGSIREQNERSDAS